MRPRLDPAMGEVVICARVARQLAAFVYYEPWEDGIDPKTAAALAASYLPLDYPGMLRFALLSLSVYLDLGMSSSVWLAGVLEASHFGHSFRRCFFFEYKANRGPYPRVTNRGVQTSPKATGARVKKGKRNV